ncbi:MAG: T9SS type A sorting domain-containing protein [Pseudobacter sp.]|uniref:T9SS type A sorting domain-containing protein n=1 Tax=Pseudobacter sp. TaxID=2045420 RepID=UPI003F7F2EFA
MTNHLLRKINGNYLLLITMILGTCVELQAQQRWTSVVQAGGSGGAETGRGVCTDNSGNVYYIGTFSGSNIDFQPGAGSTLLSSSGIQDIFITKYDASGNFQWAVKAGGTSQDQGIGIAADGTNVYIAGSFTGSAVFGGLGSRSATGASGTDAFVAALDASNGNFIWVQVFGASAVGGDAAHGVCVDGAGGLYVSGTFNGSATIAGVPLTATGGSGGDLFVAKFTAATGAGVWAVKGGSTASGDNGTGSAICYHPGLHELIVGGSFNGSNAIYGAFGLTNTGNNDAVLLELDANDGTFLAAHGFGGSTAGDDDIVSVCYDPLSEDVFFTGFYTGNITFTGNPQLTSAGLGDILAGRYSPDNNTFLWSASAGSSGEDRGYGIASNGRGSVYIAGYYSAAMSFGSTSLMAATAAPEILVGSFAVADGAKQWALSGSGNDASLADQARSIAVNTSTGRIAVTGQFGALATFSSFSFTSAGSVDIFMGNVAAALMANVTNTPPDCEVGCNGTATATVSGGVLPISYSWSGGGGSAATASNLCPGNYTVTITDAIGQVLNPGTTITFPAVSIANEDGATTTSIINSSNHIIANSACRLIATVEPNGVNPVNGLVSAFVKFETSVPVHPAITGDPYVQRHYQITPVSGASTATARVTLYFTQAEFDAFNAHPGSIRDLPGNSGDAAGKANVRIGKYPGNSSDGSGLPATYTGPVEVIDPADVDIVFNGTENRWEISFNVSGFSGFVLQTNSAPLPVTWLEVSLFTDALKHAQLKWKVQESGVAGYEVESSVDGGAFTSIATIPSKGDGEHAYTYSDPASYMGKVYYRIRQTDKDGRSTYSQIMILNNQSGGGTVTAYPNPTNGMVRLNVTDRSVMNTVARLYNSDGRELQQIYIRQTVTPVSLTGYAKGTYFLRLSNGQSLRLIRK